MWKDPADTSPAPVGSGSLLAKLQPLVQGGSDGAGTTGQGWGVQGVLDPPTVLPRAVFRRGKCCWASRPARLLPHLSLLLGGHSNRVRGRSDSGPQGQPASRAWRDATVSKAAPEHLHPQPAPFHGRLPPGHSPALPPVLPASAPQHTHTEAHLRPARRPQPATQPWRQPSQP